jgi:hypothetical protein
MVKHGDGVSAQWATLVVVKGRGGRGRIVNSSQRGLFEAGERYFNHRLKAYQEGSRVNVVVRLSRTGRRMVQEIKVR